MDYVQVAEEEGDEPMEIPTEEDETLLLTTLQAQFPNACGLKWRNEETKIARGVRLAENRFYPPIDKDGWCSKTFFCTFPKENKRKSDDTLEDSAPKTKRVESKLRCTDLIVLGLSFQTTEETMREHFEKYGELIMAQIKKDYNSGKSKGYGFVRFSSHEAQVRVLAARHLIDERWCEVKIPNSKEGLVQQLPTKIFVGRCTEDISTDDLRDYFSKYGEVIDVFIPRPFRAFGFVTFLSPEVAQGLCGEDHIIKGVSVYVSNAAPKVDRNRFNSNNSNNFNMNGMGQNRSNNRNGGYSGNFGGGGGGSGNYGGRSGMGGFNQNQNGFGMNNGNNYNNPGNYGMNNSNGNNAWANNQNRGNLDMPNLQALGINPQGQNTNSNAGSNMSNNPLGGLNFNSMSPALVAAALKQMGLIGSGSFNRNSNQPEQDNGGNQPWSRKSNVPPVTGSDQGNNFI